MLASLELFLLGLAAVAQAHGDHDPQQEPIAGPHKSLWYNTLPGDGGTQVGERHRSYKKKCQIDILHRPILSSPASQPLAASATFHASHRTL